MNTLPTFNTTNRGILAAVCLLLSAFGFQSCSDNELTSASAIENADPLQKEVPVISTAASSFVTPATEDIVMYEINIGAFSSTHNLQGITNRLDSIKSLGINTIWLMPIHPTGIVNSFGSPYCVRDYLAVNPSYGTLTDLKRLVTKAHERRISVILDWVGNHTSWDHVWMSNPTWYSRDGNGNIVSPPGTTWTDVAELNFNSAAMRLSMISAMRYWIDVAGVDGFRCDAANFVPSNFWQQAITNLQNGRSKQLIMLAEGDYNDQFTAGFKMNWSWAHLSALKNVFNNAAPSSLFTANTNEYAAVPSGSRKLRFTTNHDESNTALPMTVFNGKNGALCASAITIFLQGVPLIYSGQEVGVASASVYQGGTINWNSNGDMLAAYQKMLAFYNSSPAARKGNVVSYSDVNIVAFTKTLGNDEILVLANPRSTAQSYSVPASLAGNYTNMMTNTAITISGSLPFTAYKYLLLRKLD